MTRYSNIPDLSRVKPTTPGQAMALKMEIDQRLERTRTNRRGVIAAIESGRADDDVLTNLRIREAKLSYAIGKLLWVRETQGRVIASLLQVSVAEGQELGVTTAQ